MGGGRKLFEDFLYPTDMSTVEEAESGDEWDDSLIFGRKVTKIVKQLLVAAPLGG